MLTTIQTGQTLFIPAGKRVTRAGVVTTRREGAIVTVRRTEPARNGKTRVFWKSNGLTASTLV